MKKIISLFALFILLFGVFNLTSASNSVGLPIEDAEEVSGSINPIDDFVMGIDPNSNEDLGSFELPIEEAEEPLLPCTASDFQYSSWGVCSIFGQQTRTVVNTPNCSGGVTPVTTQACISSIGLPIDDAEEVPVCTESDYSYSDWSSCSNGQRSRTATRTSDCDGGFEPTITQSCDSGNSGSGGGGSISGGSSWSLPTQPITPVITPIQTPIQQVLGEKIEKQVMGEKITETKKFGFKFTKKSRLGSTGTEVRKLQELLKQLGYFKYPTITGYFGKVTQSALKAFQNDRDLYRAGYIGPLTLIELNKL